MKGLNINKRKVATTSMAVLGVGLIITGAFAALSDILSHNETITVEWVDIVDGSSTNLALEDVSDVNNTPVEELTPGITYELTGVLENDSTVLTNWTATDVTNTPGMNVTIGDINGADTPVAVGEDVDVAQFGITVTVDESVTPSTALNFAIEFSSMDAHGTMLEEPTAISSIFPDPAMASCVANDSEVAANGDVNYVISQTELDNITNLICIDMGINSIAGVEYLTNVITLDFGYNNITDLTPVANLNNLKSLYLTNNQVSDVTPLSNLDTLQVLNLNYNQVTNLEPLESLTNLRNLSLKANGISDLSSLASLTNLTYLVLGANEITDISALNNLTKLTYLDLGDNQITDLSPIANMPNLTNLYTSFNQISDFSSLTYQPGSFMGTYQEITLPDTTLGTPTPVVIDGINGQDLIITFNTPGTYVDGEVIWDNPGVNSLTYASSDGKISGTITQIVY